MLNLTSIMDIKTKKVEVDVMVSIFEQFQLKLESDLEWIVPPSPGQVDLKLESHKEWPLLPSPGKIDLQIGSPVEGKIDLQIESHEECPSLPLPGKIDLQIGSPVEWPALPSTDQLRSPLPVLRQLKRRNLDSMPSKIVKCRRKLFIFL